ncbi:hypothetical protein [Hyphobacterium indicum]|uniref:hypothetical protein n=1 Tax=Hyphobacterium indicum TaxID=2162714 RepID=UPI000D65AF24|nr:hypothetical protein [Hyphobacterium indicum]
MNAVRVRAHGEPFFLAMMLVLSGLVLAGFGPSFYFPDADRSVLSPALQIHGVIFSLWMLLLITQASLIPAGRYGIHKAMGLLSLPLVAAMIVFGFLAIGDAYARGVDSFGSPEQFVIVPFMDIVGFAGIYIAGLLFRGRPATHKRLMLLATVYAILPATARIGIFYFSNEFIGLILQIVLFLAVMAYDLISRRALHPATLIVFGLSLLRVGLLFGFGPSAAWADLVRSVLG